MIIIDKAVTAENGTSVTQHRITSIEVAPSGDALNITGCSWANSVQRAENAAPVARFADRIPFYELSGNGNVVEQVAEYLTGNGVLAGGSIIPGEAATLSDAQLMKWAEVKRWRTEAINSNMTTPYGTFQCSAEDRQNITDAIMLAQTLSAMEQPVSIPWTLADNTVIDLDASMLVNIGLLLGQKVQTAHAIARLLREDITNAETVEDLDLVVWPA